jgi:hypothetical protein
MNLDDDALDLLKNMVGQYDTSGQNMMMRSSGTDEKKYLDLQEKSYIKRWGFPNRNGSEWGLTYEGILRIRD